MLQIFAIFASSAGYSSSSTTCSATQSRPSFFHSLSVNDTALASNTFWSLLSFASRAIFIAFSPRQRDEHPRRQDCLLEERSDESHRGRDPPAGNVRHVSRNTRALVVPGSNLIKTSRTRASFVYGVKNFPTGTRDISFPLSTVSSNQRARPEQNTAIHKKK